ncbi:hypothetical protein [Nonomuraea sp. NPDC050540]|uniref:hypothetical protein n=1 Tax=Nonomuraea sp. NPDC050540 TaxID=3364367 RepID=UPI003798F16B
MLDTRSGLGGAAAKALDRETPPPGDPGPEGEPWSGGEVEYLTGVRHATGPDLASADIECHAGNGALACWKKEGDGLWITKTDSQGWAAARAWVYAWDRTKWRYIKLMECGIGSAWRVGEWRECDTDIWEDNTRNTWGGRGSGLRLRAVGEWGQGGNYAWVRNDDNIS